ncbi:MAG: choice-of-anchor D domain-containing protein, partial [Verrucomicrobia bacterium]|nr:choice-of-anchor D domain-containing protein [Verrucomicrobiota bacterium]
MELELLKGNELNGALAAYSAHSHEGSERVYVNLDWVSTLSSPERLTAVLLEEAGHAIDKRINGIFDSKGDEGAIFAKLIQGERYENLPLAIFNENDHETVFIDGVGVAIECARAGDVSLVFTEGYIGTMGNNAQKNTSVKSFNTLGISRLTFSQDDSDSNGYFNIQGNDVEGSIKIITDNNNAYTLDAAIVWNDKDGGSVVSFGIFISDVGQSNTTISSSAGDYTLVVGRTKNVSSNVSLLGLNLTDPYSENGTIQGSADNAFLDTLNNYLDASIQITGITASDITEGEDLVYNVTLESGAPDNAYYAYNIGSTDSTVTNVAFSNGVTLSTVDGTMLVPNGVSSFTVTYETTDDSTVESTKTATLTAGNLTATANILDNDSVPEIALSGNSVGIADGDTTASSSDHTDFGSHDVSTGSQTRTFTITNSGNADLNLTGTPIVTLIGSNASDFEVTTQPDASTVSASGFKTFVVEFDPTAIGLREATVSITSNDADEATYTFAIQGNSTSAGSPLACVANFFQIYGDTGIIAYLDATTDPYTYTTIGTAGYKVNAVGYNIEDGFLYGQAKSGSDKDKFLKIDSTGTITILNSITATFNSVVADFNTSGDLYMFQQTQKKVGILDVSAGTITEHDTTGEELAAKDMAYRHSDGVFYGVKDYDLFAYDPSTHNVT